MERPLDREEREERPLFTGDGKGTMCYSLGWISGVVALITEKENEFVRFHVIQSTVTFFLATVAWYATIQIAPYHPQTPVLHVLVAKQNTLTICL